MTILLYTESAAFRSYCTSRYPRAGKELGVYDPLSSLIVVDLSGGAAYLPTLTHEIVHALLDADFLFAPLWFQEGLASLFEAPVFPADGGIRGVAKNLRHPRLLAGLASAKERKEVRLDALFGMTDEAFEARSDAGIDEWLKWVR